MSSQILENSEGSFGNAMLKGREPKIETVVHGIRIGGEIAGFGDVREVNGCHMERIAVGVRTFLQTPSIPQVQNNEGNGRVVDMEWFDENPGPYNSIMYSYDALTSCLF